jgi:mannose-1-phosphate guanylyltransferase
MAGGTGSRLWPVSRRDTPKQSLRLVGERTMFQSAIDRIAPLFRPDRILVVAGAGHQPTLSQQAPELLAGSFVSEPEGRGTAPCIGLAAVHLRRRDPDAVMAVLTADQVIQDAARFRSLLSAAHDLAQQGLLVTLGITPRSASTGYGYIRQGEKLGTFSDFAAFRVEQFAEKPDQAIADRMAVDSRYSWNSGMFIWRVDRILEEFQRQMPDLYSQLARIETSVGRSDYERTLAAIWPHVRKETIDYGVMEGAADVAVIPADIGWSDVGSWASLAELLPEDDQGNVVKGNHLGIDTRNSLVVGGKRLIATVGIEDLVIVDTEDALLICPRGREQSVREIVYRLETDGRSEYL